MYPNSATHLNPSQPFSPQLQQRNGARSLAQREGTNGSVTQTVTPSRPTPPPDDEDPLILRLRGAHDNTTLSTEEQTEEDVQDSTGSNNQRQRRTRIQWASTVIDNEGLGRKKSKVCCIYHKPRAVGESSDESDSSSSSDNDSDSDDGRNTSDGAKPGRARRGRGRDHNHDHDHNHSHEHGGGNVNGKRGQTDRKPSPNAYEKMPKYDVQPLKEQPTSGS